MLKLCVGTESAYVRRGSRSCTPGTLCPTPSTLTTARKARFFQGFTPRGPSSELEHSTAALQHS